MIIDQRESSFNAFGYIYLNNRLVEIDKSKQILNTDNE